MAENTYSFDLPTHHKSIIKVIGVGGGGSNAINHMFNLGIKDVDFVVCNTDHQALDSSPVPNKLQIGTNLTGGLGAGANPEKGRNAAIESKEDIKELLSDDTKMVFVTAGMGGGTGTGGAPVIAQVAKEMDILTVGIVTAPFGFEGKKKRRQADEGIEALKNACDTVLVISNDKIKEIFGNLPIREAFAEADNVLTTAAKGIAEIITVPGYVNVDFEDVKTVMLNAGAAVMGSSQTNGDNRAIRAAESALNSPLLNNQNIMGAEKILLSIMSGEDAELQMDELTEITDYIEEHSGGEAEVIFGHGVDSDLGEDIRVTVIATGFEPRTQSSPKPLKQEEHDDSYTFEKEESNENEVEEKDRENYQVVYDLESSKRIRQTTLWEEDEEEHEEPEMGEEEKEYEEEDNEITFEFDFDFPEKEEADETEDIILNSDEEYEFLSDDEDSFKEDDDAPLEELDDMAHPPSRKYQLMEARQKREEELNRINGQKGLNPDSFKEKWDVPAYERKKINFQKVPHSSERNISKYNLTDDNQILGNNRFLHDNVD